MSHDFIKTASPAPHAALASRVRDVLLAVKAAWRAWINRREAMATVAQMDARMLADIGLTRGDVRSALAEPLWSDPTIRLRLYAVERRAALRARARASAATLQGEADRPAPLKDVPAATCG